MLNTIFMICIIYYYDDTEKPSLLKYLIIYNLLMIFALPVSAQKNKVDIGLSAKKVSKKHKKNRDESAPVSTRFFVNWPLAHRSEITQTLYSSLSQDTIADIDLRCYQLMDDDSILCYHIISTNRLIKQGVSTTEFDLDEDALETSKNSTFYEIIRKFEIVPPGQYLTILKVSYNDSVIISNDVFYRQIDSTLNRKSDLRSELNSEFLDKKNGSKKIKLTAKSDIIPLNEEELQRTNTRLSRKLKSKFNVNTLPETINNKTYSSLYYKNWFLGRYEVIRGEQMVTKVKNDQKLNSDPFYKIDNEFLSFDNISSGIKDVFQKKEKKNNNQGIIDVTSNWGNGQEPGSEQDNTYQELYGQFNTSLLKIPVIVEGFYTTQDNNRTAKASYIRLRYDADKVKSDMAEEINVFKSKYRESKAKASNFDYTNDLYLGIIKNEENKLYKELSEDYGISKTELTDCNGNINALPERGVKYTGDDLEEIKVKYDKIREIQTESIRYNDRAKQYKDGLYFDSALVLNKLDNIKEDNISQKALAKSAEHILPDGKTKRFLSSLTSLNIGILNEHESKYTLAGQTLKGGKVGYDFNIVKVSTAIGKTEYISRDGYVDRYNSSMFKFDFKPVFSQKTGVIYYINSPTRQVFESEDFKKDVSVPTLKDPTHIVSLYYDGAIAKNLQIYSEGAVSFKKSDKSKLVNKDNTAITTTVSYDVPRTNVSVSGEWEHVGRLFENNSLPYIRAATERYTAAAKSFLFKSFLTIGIQYHLLKQSNFSTTSYNKKWGFDIKTISKRYPNVYLSYKPFSTFRSHTDTLGVQQRPMLGEVWIARTSYRIRRKHHSHNLTLVYNSNSSVQDTISYYSNTTQFGYTLSTKKDVFHSNIGWASLPSEGERNLRTYFLQIGASRRLNDQLCLNLGEEMAFAEFGMQRNSTTAGCSYSFKKLPVTSRIDVRYGKYKTDEFASKTTLWAIQLGSSIYFKNKNKN